MAKRLVLAGMLACLTPLAGAAQPIESTVEIAALLASQPPQFVDAVFPDAPAQPGVSRALLDKIAAWLGANLDLPAASELPRIEFAPAARIAAMRSGQLLALQPSGAPRADRSTTDTGRAVVALYNDRTQTIFLPEGWTSVSPTDQSILVHEMVHHLQLRAQLRYGCPEEREKLAYEAQGKWLELFGKTSAKSSVSTHSPCSQRRCVGTDERRARRARKRLNPIVRTTAAEQASRSGETP